LVPLSSGPPFPYNILTFYICCLLNFVNEKDVLIHILVYMQSQFDILQSGLHSMGGEQVVWRTSGLDKPSVTA